MFANKPLFSRSIPISSVPDTGLEVTVEANAEERAALAKADRLVAVEQLSGRFELVSRPGGQGVTVKGEVAAKIVQTCVVTLEPFPSELREPVDLLFVPHEQLEAWRQRHGLKDGDEAGPEDEDPPETIENGKIDLGRVASEFLALGLDPYPRKPGVEFDEERSAGDEPVSPFAVLAKLTQAE